MNSEIIKKIIAEWLEDKVFLPLVKRDILERYNVKAKTLGGWWNTVNG